MCTLVKTVRLINTTLAGHPLRGWPARLRGHKGSGLWKVWTVPSPPLPSPPLPSPPLPSPPLPSPPLPSPPLPCPPLPFPALPCPALPSPPLPSPPLPSPPSPPLPPLPPSLPPSRVPNLIKLGPAVWPKRASVAPPWRSASENEGSQPWCANAQRNRFFLSGIPRAVIRIGTNEWPSTRPEG